MSRVKQETLNGTKWTVLQKLTLNPVQFLYGVILARLITPEEFGILGLTAIFFALAGQLRDCGFGTALVRDIHRTEDDINTVFWSNVALSLLMSIILWCAAPWFVDFFHQPPLLWLTRVSATMMFLNSLAGTHFSLYACRRDFKTPAIINTVCTLVAMPFTIAAAYAGWGYWALMAQGVITGLLILITVWIVSPWKPQLRWKKASFVRYFSFGYKLVLRGISFSIFNNFRTFVIGKFYSPAQLGEFNRANHMAYYPNATINSILGSVTYPILATLQDNPQHLISVYIKYIRVTCLPIFFGSCLLIALCQPVMSVLYGNQWDNCVPYVQILTWAVMTYHIVEINNNLLLVKGRSDLPLKIDITKQIVHLSLMIPALCISVKAVCYAALLSAPINLSLTLFGSRKAIGVSVSEQMKAFVPYFVLSVICCAPAYLLTFVIPNDWVKIIIGGTISAALYIGMLYYLKDAAFCQLLQVLRESKFCPKLFRNPES